MFKIYTDGAARGNPGLGAWAFAVYDGCNYKGGKSAAIEHTTNNYTELNAVVEAVKWALRAGQTEIEILSDSAYVCNGFNQWMHGWKQRHWRTSSNGAVKNVELWRELYHDSKQIKVTMTKVKGHSGIHGNEQADTLCNVAMDEWELQNVVMR